MAKHPQFNRGMSTRYLGGGIGRGGNVRSTVLSVPVASPVEVVGSSFMMM
jgi:hypothetical protein